MNPKKQTPSASLHLLFSLAVFHPYVGGAAYGRFYVTPLAQTAVAMRRLGWVSTLRGNTFTLHADIVRAGEALGQSESVALDTPDLVFAIEFYDPEFVRYTDLPMQQDSVLSLTPPLQAGPPTDDAATPLTLEPAKAPAGWPAHPAGASAALVIPVKPLLDQWQSWFGFSPEVHVITRLDLPARSTIWRYDFFNHGGLEADRHEVKPVAPAAGLPVFHHVAGIAGPGGETSLAFESAAPMLLQASPQQRFRLLRDKKPLIAQLPVPGLNFSPHRSGLCSDIFVHL